MDYRKECESRMMEVSIGAHKLTQMISSWSTTKEPNLDNQRSSKDLLKGSFDVEDSLSTLRKLQRATKMMSQVREDLRVNSDRERGDQEAAGGFGSTHSRRFQSNCIEELKTVIRESGYGRNLDERGPSSSSSRSLRFSGSSGGDHDHAVAQPKRAKGGPSLIAKLMGLEAIPSDGEHEELDKCLVVRRLEPPLGIEMLKARMLPLMEKRRPEARKNTLKDVVVSKGIDDCTNMTTSGTSSFSSTSHRSSHTYGEVPPPIVILRTPPLPERKKVQSTTKGDREKVCDNAQILSEKLEKKPVKKRREIKPEAKPLQNSKQLASARLQQQQRRMSSDTRKRDDVVVQKSIPSPAASQAKLSSRVAFKLDKSRASTARSSGEVNVLSRSGANAPRSHPKSVTWGSMEPAKAKKKQQETSPSRKAIDIILAATGNAMYNDAKTINQSRPLLDDPLPNHKENSKHCNRGHRRRDPKIFCEIMVKAGKGGRNSRSSSSEAKHLRPEIDKTTIQIAANAEDVKLLLLSSQSFINHAQELFRLDGSKTSTYHQKKGAVEVRAKNAKLLLGCARELVVHRSRQLEGSNHPLNRTGWLSTRSSAVIVSVEQLVEEIAYEVGKLRVCGKVGKGAGSDQDVVYGMIEGDLGCKNTVLLNAMWHQGWMEWICLEEVDYVVGPLERLIMCGLIEELVLDLLH